MNTRLLSMRETNGIAAGVGPRVWVLVGHQAAVVVEVLQAEEAAQGVTHTSVTQ